jgi:hypothetical protein
VRTISENIKDAINAIERYGWIKDDGGSIEKGFCALGAINYATRYYENYNSNIAWQEYKLARDALARVIHTHHIARWNDNVCQSKDDVIAAFRKVLENECIS